MVGTETGSAGVRIIKTRQFAKWSKTEHISDIALAKAIAEIENGLIDADLGGGLIKKRIAINARGKSGGARTIIAYQHGQRAFFLYGYAKNKKSNIAPIELISLREISEYFLGLSDNQIDEFINLNKLYEVIR